MRGDTDNRVENYIKRHENYKRWLAFVLSLSLFTGTVTLYMLNKPATAMTEDGAGQIGLVMETADSEFEQGLIEQMENGETDEVNELQDPSVEENETVIDDVEKTEEPGSNDPENVEESNASKSASSDDTEDSSKSSSTEEVTESEESSSASSASTQEESASDASSLASSKEAASDASSEASSENEEIEVKEIKLTATLVDEFGEEIDSEKYTDIELPEFEDVLVLNDTENPPYENVKVKTGVFKTVTYSYVEAVLGNKVITGIKKDTIDVKDNSDTEESDSAAELSETDSEKVAHTRQEVIFSYTTDGENYEEITEDTVINLVYTRGTQTEYAYSDDYASITAKLQVPGAIPDDAELVVTKIDENTEGYNYDAYMSALNENAQTIADDAGLDTANEYTEDNTLMYDIAFMHEGQEIQPAEGSVSISFEFKNNQLTNELSVADEEDITVVHLPIKEEVKEQSEITSTVEATDITSEDIEVKTLTEATAQVNETEKIEFSEDSFSVFVFASGTSQKNTWNGKKQITLSDFSDVSSLLYYSVVANRLETDSHIEGNVRVGTFYTDGGASVVNQGGLRITENPITEIDVVKTVVNGYDGTFKFGFFDESDNLVGPKFEIKTNDLIGTQKIINTDSKFSAIFNTLNSGKTLYVYELNGNNIIKDGEEFGSYEVSYSYNDVTGFDSSEIAYDHDTNYIGEFETKNYAQVTCDPHFFNTNTNYIGKPLVLEGSTLYFGYEKRFGVNNMYSGQNMFIYTPNLKEQIASDMETAKEVSVALANAKNYQSGSNSTSNIVNVINLISTKGNLADDLRAANFADPYISGLISENQYLLINISVDGYDTYSLNGQDVKFDGVNPQEGYNVLGSHVIFNFVKGKGKGTYTGTVKINGNAAGLVFAPGATIDQKDGQWQGQLIGNKVIHSGQEIHKKTILSGKVVTVNVQNKSKNVITVYKLVNGEPAATTYDGKFNFIFEKYISQGKWETVSAEYTNSYDSATGLSTITIPLPELNKNKTYYFRVHEDPAKTVNTLDNDTNYIFIKVVTDSAGSITSINYYKVRGDYNNLNNPTRSIDKSGAVEVSDSNVAFNNTTKTTKITVKKEWNGGSKWDKVYAYICGRAGSNDIYGKVVELSENNNWTFTVDDLPMYDANGTVIIYRAVEIGQKVNSADQIQYVTDENGNRVPANLLYDENAAGTYSAAYEGYMASYSSSLSEAEILNSLGKSSVTGPERVGAVGESTGTVTITNTYDYSDVTLELKKYLDGKDPGSTSFEFTVSVLKKDGTLLTFEDKARNIGSIISYSTKIKSEYVITKDDGEQNVYFLIKEDNPSSAQYTKDDSYIIAKVKNLGLESQYVAYYRVSNSEEKARIDSDPLGGIKGCANNSHAISEGEVAFYNKSYSLTIRKEWYYSDGTKIAQETYDTYTPINIVVWQTYGHGTPREYARVVLSKANNWEFTLNNVPRCMDSENKRQYVYYIQEEDYSGNLINESNNVWYYKIVNGTESALTNISNTAEYGGVDIRGNEATGTLVLVCKNVRQTYSLPETGGIGDLPFKSSGLGFILFALLGLFISQFMHKNYLHKIQKRRGKMRGLKKVLTGILAGAMALTMAFGTGNAVTAKAADHTITINNASKGQKYTLYKLFDYEASVDNAEAGVYKVTDDSVKAFLDTQTDYVKYDANGYVTWENNDTSSDTDGKDTAVSEFAKNVQAAIENGSLQLSALQEITAEVKDDDNHVIKLDSKDANGVEQYKVVFDVSEYGYYLVSSTLGALVSLDTTAPNAEVYEKNTTPHIKKEVKEDSGDFGKKNDAQIGQEVEYKVTVDAKAGGKNYKVHDKMAEGLTFVADSVEVKDLPSDVKFSVVTKPEDGDTFDVVFDGTFTADATVVVTYKAVINGKAVVSKKLENDTYLEYNNGVKTEHDTTETFVYAFNLYKNDGNGHALAGAKFEIANGTQSLAFVFEETDSNGAYVYRLANADEAKKAVEVATKDNTGKSITPVLTAGTVYTEIITPASGKVYVRGFDADTYTLTETEAPEGYNLLGKPVQVVVYRENEVIDGNYKFADDVNKMLNEVSIINKSGSLLPSTGGMGTTLFYIVGGILIVAGVAYFMVRRKAQAE